MMRKILVIIMLGLIYQCTSPKGERNNSVDIESIPVRIIRLKEETYQSYHKGTGEISSDKTIHLIFEIPGRVEKVYKKTGDLVQKDEIIAQLENDVYKAQMELAQTAFRKAERDLNNSTSLHKKNAISEDNLLEAELGLKMAKADVVLAKKTLENTIIKAPFTGQISYLNLKESEYFNPVAMNEFPVIVTDMNSLQIETTVSAKFISQIEIGDPVEFSLKNIDSLKFSGFVSETGLMPIKMSNSYNIKLSISNPQKQLRLGMLVDYKILTDTFENVSLLPNRFILEDNHGMYVHILKDQKVHRKLVNVIKSNGGKSLIKEKFPTGTKLITDGTRKVNVGNSVTIIE